MPQDQNRLAHYGSIAGSVVAILGLLWLLGEPFLEDYVDTHIRTYDERKKEEDSKSVKFRSLCADKMGVAEDEAHIELGKVYKKVMSEADLLRKIDSLGREVQLNYAEIGINLKDIKNLKSVVIDLEQRKQDR